MEGAMQMAATETELERLGTTRKNGTGAPAPDRPAVVFHESARALMTPDVREVLGGVLSVVYDRARQEAVEPARVEVYATSACEEIGARLIVSIQTDLPADPAFALWDALSDAVQDWTSTLPKAQEDIALDLISLEVEGSLNSAAPRPTVLLLGGSEGSKLWSDAPEAVGM